MKAMVCRPTTSDESEGTIVSESPEANASGNDEASVREGVEVWCDLWDGEPTETKLHSRFYYLEPIAVGDPMVESLTSYVTRLAEAHSVSPRTLIKNEIAPLLRKTSLYQSGHLMSGHFKTYLKQSHTLNGTTLWAEDMVEVLEQLTGRHDLRFLTTLSWKHVISTQKLLRWSRAWCPKCYEQRQETNQIVYEPLLWSLDVMSVCHIHRIPLQTQCPYTDCNRIQPPVSSHTQPGYCSQCQRWLGNALLYQPERLTPCDDEEWPLQQRIALGVGELLSKAPALLALPQREEFLSTIEKYAAKLTGGDRKALVHQLQCNFPAIRGWLFKKRIPTLTYLLFFCLHLETSPFAFLTGHVEEGIPQGGRPKRRYRKFNAESVRQQLEAAAQGSEDAPPSLHEVARRLDYHPSKLQKHFPELCQTIAMRYRTGSTFIQRVYVNAGGSGAETAEKQVRRFPSEEIRCALEEVLQTTGDPPPSMKAVAARLGYHSSTIGKHFPEHCRAISTRYRAAQAAKKEQRTQSICSEVRDIVRAIHEQGRYPSKRQVGKLLKRPQALQETEVRQAWRATLRELGFN